MHRENHYVPRLYLKHFEATPGKVQTYRLLVSHAHIPLWKLRHIGAVGYHSHLYTRLIAGEESDDIENWLGREFETPAEEPIRKVTEDRELASSDWRALIRFLAAQDVRTPARLIESMKRSTQEAPTQIEEVLAHTKEAMRIAKETGKPLPKVSVPNSEYMPLRVTTEIDEGKKEGLLKVELVVGRGTWHFEIKHLLDKTLDVLLQHSWGILKPPDGLLWFTSDNPVIKLNYYNGYKYDFGGGWGRVGSEIMLPLSPHHLLYTRIGTVAPSHGTTVTRRKAKFIRRFIAEHAHRMIFASTEDPQVRKLKGREVNLEKLRYESEQWRDWHRLQSEAERDLLAPRAAR
jgi:hypothetical protein